ncbi:MAG: tRNA glutamyl-Q(34) synthetase GluQRS [Nitrosomonadales bacterium]|nr:MAG: tRNA glutamyl-Q(34) synthetase GluQRS [Nitrosomonadales bacterium]
MNTRTPSYRGRFAPSPTGSMHFGSLVAAVGSYLDARSCQGKWLVRMEDLDPPRVVAGAADNILRTLEAFGLFWDGDVVFQSRRGEAYRAALDVLQQQGVLYPCNCSRREIADSALEASTGLIYQGQCRSGMRKGRAAHALRVITDNHPIKFCDRLLGDCGQRLEADVGDFVLRRADGLYAYQLAVVVDDAEQGITHIVRGADILDSTPRQIYLQHLLGLSTPSYLHLPVAVNVQGEKLSKQTLAPALNPADPVPQLVRALGFLGQEPPPGLAGADLADFWAWAVANWSARKIPPRRAIPASSQ